MLHILVSGFFPCSFLFFFFFGIKSLKLSVIYTHRTSQFRLIVFQVVNIYMWLVATI